MTLPNVSVVIPTAGRASVLKAVSAALEQTHAPLEVIVVDDSNQSSTAASALRDISGAVRVFFTGGIGGNGARMRGVAEAKGEIIAFLDDDDVWAPEKLERQLALWRDVQDGGSYMLASCRIALIDTNGQMLKTLPARLLGARERVAGYLFRNTSLSGAEGMLHTSTLMCDRALVELEPWDTSLSRHQDWDWVLRISDRPDVALQMCPEVLVGVTVPDKRSVSRSSDWRSSLKWLEERANLLTARERGDFLLCCTAHIAVRSGSRRGGFIAACRAVRCGRPGFTAWLVWGLHMLSPRIVDRATAIRRSVRARQQTIGYSEPSPG
jgi:glycosyltransferase involved in cell wall biosynthesis